MGHLTKDESKAISTLIVGCACVCFGFAMLILMHVIGYVSIPSFAAPPGPERGQYVLYRGEWWQVRYDYGEDIGCKSLTGPRPLITQGWLRFSKKSVDGISDELPVSSDYIAWVHGEQPVERSPASSPLTVELPLKPGDWVYVEESERCTWGKVHAVRTDGLFMLEDPDTGQPLLHWYSNSNIGAVIRSERLPSFTPAEDRLEWRQFD